MTGTPEDRRQRDVGILRKHRLGISKTEIGRQVDLDRRQVTRIVAQLEAEIAEDQRILRGHRALGEDLPTKVAVSELFDRLKQTSAAQYRLLEHAGPSLSQALAFQLRDDRYDGDLDRLEFLVVHLLVRAESPGN